MEKLIKFSSVFVLLFISACTSSLSVNERNAIAIDFDQINTGIKREIRRKLNGVMYKINEEIYITEAEKYINVNKDDSLFLDQFKSENGHLIFKGFEHHYIACAEFPRSHFIICDYTKSGFPHIYEIDNVTVREALEDYYSTKKYEMK